jgi:hypothetical protein
MLNNGRERFTRDISRIREELGNFDSYQLAANEIIRLLKENYGTLPTPH